MYNAYMNKLVIAIGFIVLILASIFVYIIFFTAKEIRPEGTGVVRNIKIVAKENQWRLVPEEITVDLGDRIILEATNEDDYAHGIAIDVFGISQMIPPKETIIIDFVAAQAGDFPFYCSIICGEGIVDGKKRTHFDMTGKLHVRSAVSETK